MYHHPMPSSHRPRLSQPPLTAVLMFASVLQLGSCGGRQPQPPSSPEEAASRLITWSLGARRDPKLRGGVRVLRRAAAQPLDQAREVSVCGPEADSMIFLPEENTVLVTANGVLYTVRADGTGAAFQKAAFAPMESIDYLLARKRGARPALVLALVTNKQSGRPSFWNLRVDRGKVTGHKLASMADFASLSTYLRAYEFPRCRSRDEDCVIVDKSGKTTAVLRESKRGVMPRDEDDELSSKDVRDVIWDADGGQWLLRGATCSTPAESSKAP